MMTIIVSPTMRCRYARVATGDPAVMRDGRTSYPSGHAAETFMAFGLLSVYLLAKLKLFTRQSQVIGVDLGAINIPLAVQCGKHPGDKRGTRYEEQHAILLHQICGSLACCRLQSAFYPVLLLHVKLQR
jgi:hypothetical protein